ncbi:hypothetical protein [Kineosporia sp. A_224]|uniref:hypothetical protein n=1 Tax=Kineosporia sp. A_224 TaxID=1962180 RepID=UPI000B4B00DE|nr:hypothetical protein [Kineosporia sp. A_224]
MDDLATSALTGREWALVIWTAAALIGSMVWPGTRRSAIKVAKAAAAWKILAIFVGLWCYTAVALLAAGMGGLWGVGLLKDAVLWSVSAGVLLVARGIGKRPTRYFRTVLLQILTVSAVVQFVASLYSFSLAVELVAVPCAVLLGALEATARLQGQHQVKNIFVWVLSIWGLVVVTNSGLQLLARWEHIDWGIVVRQAALPIWLTAAVVPYAYVVALVSDYEVLLGRWRWQARARDGRSVPWLGLLIGVNVRLSRLEALRRSQLWDFSGSPREVARQVRLATSGSDVETTLDLGSTRTPESLK